MTGPNYQQLEQVILQLNQAVIERDQTILEQQKAIQELKTKVAQFELKFNQNSRNSSNPPSKDRKGNTPARKPSGKKKRPHHKGAGRKPLSEDMVTSRETRVIDKCPRCRSEMQTTGDSTKWQQVDLPPIKPLVHEIELKTCKCSKCGLVQTPKLEEHEKPLMKANLEGFVNLLMGRFRYSHHAVRSFISLLIPGLDLSQGLISKVKKRGAHAFEKATEELMPAILNTPGAKFIDATGWRHMGTNYQLLIFRSARVCRYLFRSNQNGDTIAAILPGGVDHLVTDRGLAIRKTNVTHLQYCLAHLLRNIQGVAEDRQVSIGETQTLGKIYEALQQLFHEQHRYDRSEITGATWKQNSYRKWAWMREMFESLLETTSYCVLRRFCRRVLRGWKHFMVYLARYGPMTNNLAEEGLRNLVIARKLCFGSRSSYGLQWREVVHSCIETLQRQGKAMMSFFAETIQSFRMGTPRPSLVY